MDELLTPHRPRKRPRKHLYLRAYVAVRYPNCRLDWVTPDTAMLTSPDGDMWLIRDRKPADWWMQLAVKLIPGSICVGGGWLLGVMAAQIMTQYIEDCSTCDFIDQVCQRLAEYERTGLEPEEVMMELQINKNLVEQLERQWIPVEERLPESDEMVLVTCQTKKGVLSVNRAYYSGGFWHGSGSMAGVIAWMPLPPPYRPESLREAGEDAAQGGLMPGA